MKIYVLTDNIFGDTQWHNCSNYKEAENIANEAAEMHEQHIRIYVTLNPDESGFIPDFFTYVGIISKKRYYKYILKEE